MYGSMLLSCVALLGIERHCIASVCHGKVRRTLLCGLPRCAHVPRTRAGAHAAELGGRAAGAGHPHQGPDMQPASLVTGSFRFLAGPPIGLLTFKGTPLKLSPWLVLMRKTWVETSGCRRTQ